MSSKALRNNRRHKGDSRRDPWTVGFVIALVIFAGLFVLAVVLNSKQESNQSASHSDSGSSGPSRQLASGVAPSFSRIDAVTGKTLSKADFKGKNLLIFFSEGVACQACMVQIAALERRSEVFERRDMTLVSVSTDPVDALRQAAREYKLKTTPMLADEDRTMSTDYDMLGRGGMGHPDQDGHAFMLVDPKGRIAWQQDYTEMYVKPSKLFADMSKS